MLDECWRIDYQAAVMPDPHPAASPVLFQMPDRPALRCSLENSTHLQGPVHHASLDTPRAFPGSGMIFPVFSPSARLLKEPALSRHKKGEFRAPDQTSDSALPRWRVRGGIKNCGILRDEHRDRRWPEEPPVQGPICLLQRAVGDMRRASPRTAGPDRPSNSS